MVRWPRRASSRTPFSAASAAFTWFLVDSMLLLAASSCAQACAHADAGLVAGDAEIELLLALRLLGLADRGIFGAALVERRRVLQRCPRRVNDCSEFSAVS